MPFIPTTTPGDYHEGLLVQLVMADAFFLRRVIDNDNPADPGRQLQGAILEHHRMIDGCPEGTAEVLFMPGLRTFYIPGPGPKQLTT